MILKLNLKLVPIASRKFKMHAKIKQHENIVGKHWYTYLNLSEF